MEDEELRTSEKELIANTLNRLPFVKWDRASFLLSPRIGKNRRRELWLAVFGWIDREDSYKDFIVLDFQLINGTLRPAVFSCSSSKFSEQAVKIIMGADINHNSCFRVESIVGVEKCIKLEKGA